MTPRGSTAAAPEQPECVRSLLPSYDSERSASQYCREQCDCLAGQHVSGIVNSKSHSRRAHDERQDYEPRSEKGEYRTIRRGNRYHGGGVAGWEGKTIGCVHQAATGVYRTWTRPA